MGNKSKDGTSVTAKTSRRMAVTLTQDPANNIKTNKPVTIRVSSNTSIKEAKWIKGSGSAQEVWANGTAITDKSFTVDENGSYSVAVQDNEGQVEIKTIEIRNIDKIPPQPVRDLQYAILHTNKKSL